MKKTIITRKRVKTGAPSGFVVSLIIHAGAFFAAGLFVVFTVVNKSEPEFEPPPPIERPKMKLKKPKVKVKKSSQPKPSSRIVAKVKTRDMPEIQLPDLAGDGEGLLGGTGVGGFDLDLPEIQQMSVYGAKQSSGTELIGIYYDMKFSRSGRYIGQDPSWREHVRNFINEGMAPRTMSQFYRAPQKLYAKCLVMGLEPSAMAPTAFGMPDDMCEGGSWIVHYSGNLVHKEDITFRFWGAADDFMAIALDGEMVFGTALTRGRYDEIIQNGYSPPGMISSYRWGNSSYVVPGDWITLKAGVPRRIDMVIGDNPPPKAISQCMFILAVEEQGAEYEENYAGWPIFPIFKTGMLSHDELDLIYQVTEAGLVNCTNGPVFNDFEDPEAHSSGASNDPEESSIPVEPTVPDDAMEQWKLADGTVFEAEYVMEMTGYATFRNAEGKEVKVELDQLSPESRMQIDLKNPPRLEFDLVKDQNRKSFSGGRERGTGSRPPEDRVHYGARVYTRSNTAYDYPMDLEVFVIGQERLGENYILLDKFEVTFRLNKENRKKFEYKNDRMVVLRNYTSRDEPRGEDYRGFVAIVRDMQGEVIATFASPKFFLDHLDNLRRRSIGSFINKDGTRTFPTRPKAYF